MLVTPMMQVKIPDAMTICQKERPRTPWLVAVLFRLPRIETPTTIKKKPRVKKPEVILSKGQLREK